jgi:hypothetical protein
MYIYIYIHTQLCATFCDIEKNVIPTSTQSVYLHNNVICQNYNNFMHYVFKESEKIVPNFKPSI